MRNIRQNLPEESHATNTRRTLHRGQRKGQTSPSLHQTPLRFVTHSRRVQKLATSHGWLPGARYTNLRDVRCFDRLGFLDIDWKNYAFNKHLNAARATRPFMTVAQDVEDQRDLQRIIDEAYELALHSDHVIIVPKDPTLEHILEDIIPVRFLLGYSVPTRYGKTSLPLSAFRRPVHLLGGRPDVQRRLANHLDVFSLDCNRFSLDASFGDYFDGEIFRPHPVGGYERCINDSLININALWKHYAPNSFRGSL